MTVKAELQFITDAAKVASDAAIAVARYRKELELLQGLNGKTSASPIGGNVAGIQAKGAADIATVQAKGIADVQRAVAKANADAAAHQHRVAEQYQKDRNAILVSGAAASHAMMAQETAHAHKIAEIEKKGAVDAHKLRIKSEEDRARIAAKQSADQAKLAQRAAMKRAAGPSKSNDAIGSLVRGGGIQGAADAMGGKAGAIVAVGAIAVGAAAKVGELTVEFGKAVVGAQAYKEDVQEAFKVVRRTVEAGNATMQLAAKTADRLGVARSEISGQFLDLATKGFDDKKIEQITGALYDLTTIDPKASIEGLTKVIGQVQATGRLNQETLNQLSTFGLEQSDVIKEIGKLLGKGDKEVLRLLSSAGGIRGLGVDPILSAISAQVGGGVAGDKQAAKARRNMSALIRQIEDIPKNVLFDIEAGPGLDTIKAVLKEVIDYFAVGTKSGERVRKVLGDTFNALAEGLFGKRAGDSDGIAGTLDRIVTFAEDHVGDVRDIAEGVGTLGRAMLALASGDTSKLDESTKRIVGVINVVKELGLLLMPGAIGGTFGPGGLIQPMLDILGIDADATEVRKWVDAVAGLLNPMNLFRSIKAGVTGGDTTLGNLILQAIQGAIAGASESAIASARSLGADIVSGLVGGIQSGLSRIGTMASNMGSTVIASVRGALDSHSPARELIAVGIDSAIGLAMGGERGTPMVASSFAAMATAGLMAASTVQPMPLALPSGLMPGGTAQSSAMMARDPIVIHYAPVITVTVQGNADGNAIAQAIDAQQRKAMREEIVSFLEGNGGR